MQKIIDKIILIFILLLVFNGILRIYVSDNFKYIDEILEIFIITGSMAKAIFLKKSKIEKYDLIILVNMIIMIIIGIIGNITSKYQSSIFNIITDILSWQKFFTVFVASKYLFSKNNEKIYYKLEKYCKFFIVLGLIIYFFQLLNVFNFNTGKRLGITVFALGGHPSFTSALYAATLSYLLQNKEKNKFWIIVSGLLCILTLRSKAFGFVGIILGMLLLIRKNRKIKISTIIVLLIIGAFIAKKQIEFYFLDTTASRAVALQTSIKIANEFFPIGSGYATFGTITSTTNYSLAYGLYGLSNRWGFSLENSSFVGDGGWATIIGQFGYIGVVLMLINLFIIFKRIIEINKKRIVPYSLISLLIYIIISSSNEIFFNSDISVIYAIMFALIINHEDMNFKLSKRENNYEKKINS